MNSQMRLVLVVLAACTLGTACISADDSRAEFCENADPARRQEICGNVDAQADGGPKQDAGQPACKSASDCQVSPNSCLNPGSCLNGFCSYQPKPDDDPCSDGPQGQCLASQGVCKSGVCRYPPKTGEVCSDSDSCTINDVCSSSGLCGGSRLICNPPPTQCEEWTGACSNDKCEYRRRTAGSTCDDGNSCTVNDACNANGGCIGTPLNCAQKTPPDGQCYEWAGTCANNACVWRLKTPGTSCSDGNACTEGDACNGSGQCVTGEPVVCPARTEFCQDFLRCDPANGCLYQSRCGPNEYCDGTGTCCPHQQLNTGPVPGPVCPVFK